MWEGAFSVGWVFFLGCVSVCSLFIPKVFVLRQKDLALYIFPVIGKTLERYF